MQSIILPFPDFPPSPLPIHPFSFFLFLLGDPFNPSLSFSSPTHRPSPVCPRSSSRLNPYPSCLHS